MSTRFNKFQTPFIHSFISQKTVQGTQTHIHTHEQGTLMSSREMVATNTSCHCPLGFQFALKRSHLPHCVQQDHRELKLEGLEPERS